MRILVTGGAGFIGSHVVDAYIAAGHELAVLDDLSTGSEKNVNAAKLLADLFAPDFPIPVGVLTGLLGAPFFLLLLVRARRREVA